MAAKFRKVDPRTWTDEKFRKLNAEGRLLALWMLTSTRVNRCGVVMWSPGLASEETGIPATRIDTVCDTVCHTLTWSRDPITNTVFLRRWWRYNKPDNEKALKGALSDLHDIPTGTLKSALLEAMQDVPSKWHTVYRKALDTVSDTVCHTVSDTVCAQEQEQEKEKEQEQDNNPLPPSLDTEVFRNAWASWIAYKGKVYKKAGRTAQINRLSAMGAERATAAITYSIAQGYDGIFEERDNGKPRQEPSRPLLDQPPKMSILERKALERRLADESDARKAAEEAARAT